LRALMTIKLLWVTFFILISNICLAGIEQDLEEIKKNMKIAYEKIEETKHKLKRPNLVVSDPIAASGGFEFRMCGFSRNAPEARDALLTALTHLTEVLSQIKFFAESYPELEQAETLLNLHSAAQHPLEHALSVSHVLIGLPYAPEITNQLQEVENLAEKINSELSRI
ncbi:hypothetical protein, partial [Endozoicomonas sp. SESOKO2]|uniref:hypothetical protein n=2 Tax=Endozoicomonas TaxID=305899 RepID=UPI002148308E